MWPHPSLFSSQIHFILSVSSVTDRQILSSPKEVPHALSRRRDRQKLGGMPVASPSVSSPIHNLACPVADYPHGKPVELGCTGEPLAVTAAACFLTLSEHGQGSTSRLSVEPRVFVLGWWRWELKLVVCVLIKTTVHHGGRNPYFQRERITPDKQIVHLLPLLSRSSFLSFYYISVSFLFFPFSPLFQTPLACFLSFTSFIPPRFPCPSPLLIPHFCFFKSVFCFLPLISLRLLPLVLFVFLSPSHFFHQNQYKIGFLRSILFYFHNAYWPLVSTESSLNDFLFPFPSFWLTNMKIQWSSGNGLDTDADQQYIFMPTT